VAARQGRLGAATAATSRANQGSTRCGTARDGGRGVNQTGDTFIVIETGDVCAFCGAPDLSCTLSTLNGGPYCCADCEKASTEAAQ
jgi:hypothetical protein